MSRHALPLLQQLIIFRMMADPIPDHDLAIFYCHGSIGQAYPGGPKIAA
jgi:hypothetical protein